MFKSATLDRASAKSSNSTPFHRETEQEAFIQPKLNIGKPNDKYEVEADLVADKVVNKTSLNGESSFSHRLKPFRKGKYKGKKKQRCFRKSQLHKL